MSKHYLIWNTLRGAFYPDLVVWWKPNQKGYTSSVGDAGRYTLDEAVGIQDGRQEDVAVPEDVALELSMRVVLYDNLRDYVDRRGDLLEDEPDA